MAESVISTRETQFSIDNRIEKNKISAFSVNLGESYATQ